MKWVIPRPGLRLDTLARAMKEAQQQPYIKLTQGGSSRKDRGAKVAAVDANTQRGKNGQN